MRRLIGTPVNLSGLENRLSSWRDGSLEIHHFLARAPGLMHLVAVIMTSSRRKYESVVGQIGNTRIEDLSGSYIDQVVRVFADFDSQAIRRGIGDS